MQRTVGFWGRVAVGVWGRVAGVWESLNESLGVGLLGRAVVGLWMRLVVMGLWMRLVVVGLWMRLVVVGLWMRLTVSPWMRLAARRAMVAMVKSGGGTMMAWHDCRGPGTEQKLQLSCL